MTNEYVTFAKRYLEEKASKSTKARKDADLLYAYLAANSGWLAERAVEPAQLVALECHKAANRFVKIGEFMRAGFFALRNKSDQMRYVICALRALDGAEWCGKDKIEAHLVNFDGHGVSDGEGGTAGRQVDITCNALRAFGIIEKRKVANVVQYKLDKKNKNTRLLQKIIAEAGY